MRNENIVNVDFRNILLLSITENEKDGFEKNFVTCCTSASWRGNYCVQNHQTISKEKYDLGLATKFAHMSLSN